MPHMQALNSVCPYFTMFPLAFPMSVLKGARTGLVIDPFCGRGTTNLAARIRGLPTLGVDSSPVAVAATSAKLSRGSTSAADIVALAQALIEAYPDPDIPEGEFWAAAYHPEVLRAVCAIRKGLNKLHLSDAARALRGVMLGALHGPKHQSGTSYFSNQSPRTYAPKPRYAVKFWRKRRLRPPRVDVIEIIKARAERAYNGELIPVRSRVHLGDSRQVSWSSLIGDLGPARWIVTSPPYFGLRTYRPDQWLREWFLGGPVEVSYTAESQISHGSPEKFADDLTKVWARLAEHAAPDARMVIRFGAINDRPLHPTTLIKASLAKTPWRAVKTFPAGFASSGRRQATSFNGGVAPALEEVDVHCRL
jgi:hypothetical protein